MGKSAGNINLIMLFRGEKHAGPFSKMRGADSNIHGDVESFALDDAAQLRLRMVQLIMKPAQSASCGARMIILDEDVGVCPIQQIVRRGMSP